MPIQGKYLFIASMDVAPEKEALFNEVYDQEHIPFLSKVPGVISTTRLKMEPLELMLGGQRQTIAMKDEPRYMAIYELTGPEVLLSQAWSEAGEKGRWGDEVRPFTKNRRHVLRRVM